METFFTCYEKNLIALVSDKSSDYGYTAEKAPEVARRIRAAYPNVNIDSPAFRKTCRELKIKCTYKAIAEFIASNP